jgi:hypothetical protein
LASSPELTFGSGWIGMSSIQTAKCSSPFAATSALESRSNLDFTCCEKEEAMNVKKYAKKFSLLCLLTFVFVPALQAQIKHIEMRVEGMT